MSENVKGSVPSDEFSRERGSRQGQSLAATRGNPGLCQAGELLDIVRSQSFGMRTVRP